MWLRASFRMKKSPKKSDFVGEAPMILILGHFRINPARFAEAQPVMPRRGHWRDQWPRLGITGRDLHRYEVASAAPC